MYRNNGLSFIEIIVVVSIMLIISSISLIYFSSMNKTFVNIAKSYQREKEILTCKELIKNFIDFNETKELRIIDIKKSKKIKDFSEIFNSPSENIGNLLIIRVSSINSENKICHYYKCFLLYNNTLIISYYNDKTEYKFRKIFNDTIYLSDCYGQFIFLENNFRIQLFDNKRGDYYEEILF